MTFKQTLLQFFVGLLTRSKISGFRGPGSDLGSGVPTGVPGNNLGSGPPTEVPGNNLGSGF